MRILVVEDEKNLNRIISEAMEDEGYSTDSCFNGLEALDFCSCAQYDVIILDVNMPKMDGFELVRTLRSRGVNSPVLFLTARDSVADRVEGLDSGGDYYLVKPFDIDPSEIDKNVRTTLAVVGDCKETLRRVTELIDEARHDEWIAGFEPYKDKERARVIEPAIHPTEGPLLMGEVVRAVSEASEHRAVLVTDVGQNQMFGCRYFQYSEPRSVVTSGGCGTMGFGLPAAIGATFGAPERTVCLFVGDGGLQMTIQELGTIMEQKAPVKIILLNNNYLGNVRQWQYMFFHKRYSFTPMLNPDYEQIASAYGIPSRTVIERADLDDAIREMLTTDGPYLLQCAVKEEDNVLPMTPPGGSVDEMLLEVE